MLIFVAKIILISSIGGMLYAIIRKIPAMAALPESEMVVPEQKKSFPKKKLFPKIKNFKDDKEELETEKPDFSDDYWEKIRKG